MNIQELRRDYAHSALDARDVNADPMRQFAAWFHEAQDAEILEPNAMTLCTCDTAGRPAGRIVLLKGFDAQGFVFFTNYTSHKAQQLEARPQAALVFYWDALERQVRITGTVEKVSREESEAYFRSRPRKSQLAAWISQQSRELESREALESRYAEIEAKYEGRDVPCPPFWGGYRVRPEELEFWQGRRSRLHDRIVYRRDGDAGWRIARLSP